jgi:endonuclease/exonuclease/phosphatase family metal-dependent hydrolase
MRLLTWNLNGLDPTFLDERTEAAVMIMLTGLRIDELGKGKKSSPPPDVIVLQEVVARTFKAHIQKHLTAVGFTVLPNNPPDRQTFEVVAFRSPYSLRAYSSEPLDESMFGRVLHKVDLDGPEGPFRVLTAHFDSGTEESRTRTRQLRHVAGEMGPLDVFGGDANMRKNEWTATKPSLNIRDAWEVLGEPASTKVTWKHEQYRARFDRLWIGEARVPTKISPVGTTNIPGVNGPPSDHIGLLLDC